MTEVRAARLSASAFVEEPGDVGAHNRADAEMAESGQGGALEMARDRRRGGRLPPARVPFHKLGGERLERWTEPGRRRGCHRPSRGRGRQRGGATVVRKLERKPR